MRLKESKVCLDCDEVWTGGNACPQCGSTSWIWLQKWVRPMTRGWNPSVVPRGRGHEVTV